MNIQQQFRQSIRCGTGAAYLLARDHPAMDFSKEVVKAALANLSYDNQSEGDRSDYVARLVNLSARRQEIIARILQALACEREDVWALEQLFNLAATFAEQGVAKARRAVRRRYYRPASEHADWCGADAVIRVYGLRGLMVIANARGRALVESPGDHEHSSLVDDFQRSHPEINVREELAKAATSNERIKKYLDEVERSRLLQTQRPKPPPTSYESVKAIVDSGRPRYVPPRRIGGLSAADIQKLADDFLKETSLAKLECYLGLFSKIKYPFDYRPIFLIAQGTLSRQNRLTEQACRALRYFGADDIRQFAIEKLRRSNRPAVYLPLLTSNYREGDHLLLAGIAAKHKNVNTVHALACEYIDIYRVNKTRECRGPLEVLYEKLNCGLHRRDLLEILQDNGVLSDKLLREMAFDSYDGVRALHERIVHGQGLASSIGTAT